MTTLLGSILVCPRCRGGLAGNDELRCERCSAVFAVRAGIPRMADGADQRDEQMADEWQAQALAHPLYMDRAGILNRWEEEVLPALVGWLGDVQGPILDVGCGVGHLGNALAAAGTSNADLVGIDFQGLLLEEARTGYRGLVEGDVHRMPFRDGAFGAAIASNSLHHFPDARTAMAEIARVLAPGGVFVAYDPRFVTPLEAVKRLLRRNDKMFAKEHKAFRIDEYRELLSSGGLTVTDIRTVDPLGPLIATALDYLKVGRLGVALPLARALVRVDRLLVDGSGQTPLGLMLAGRAVRPASPSPAPAPSPSPDR